jgi:hypothetical protein
LNLKRDALAFPNFWMEIGYSRDHVAYLYTIQNNNFVLMLMLVLSKSLRVPSSIRVDLFLTSREMVRPYVE